MKIHRLTLAALLMLGSALVAQEDYEDDYGPKPTGAPTARDRYESDLKEHAGNEDMLVLPGLLADRKAQTVEVLAECTGLAPGEAAEFLLINQKSSHGYEALLWSFAKPSDVHRALEFIGLEPGAPFDPRMLRFWADGDRVNIDVREIDGMNAFAIEKLILDTETGKTLPEEGFVFAGSMMIPPREGQPKAQYAADVYDPRSVASIYNEPAAVLDVPRQVTQGEVYGKQVVNPEFMFEGGQLLMLVMTPSDDEGLQPREFVLSIDQASGTNGVVCVLSEDGKDAGEPSSFSDVLQTLVTIKRESVSPRVEFRIGDAVSVASATKACGMLTMMESMGMVRVEAPPEGHLYYRAFVPQKEWFRPEGRPTQPWELHLSRRDGKVVGEMVWHEAIWPTDGIEPTFKPHNFPAPTPEALMLGLAEDARKRKEAGDAQLPAVLLIYAPTDLNYADIARFARPVVDTQGTIYVFAQEGQPGG